MTTNTLPSKEQYQAINDTDLTPEILENACRECTDETKRRLQILIDQLKEFEVIFSDNPETIQNARRMIGQAARVILGMTIHETFQIPVTVEGMWLIFPDKKFE